MRQCIDVILTRIFSVIDIKAAEEMQMFSNRTPYLIKERL